MTNARLIRGAGADSLLGIGRSTRYVHIAQELIVPPVEIGNRGKRFPEAEILEIQRARIAGATDDQVRELVRNLVAARTKRPTAVAHASPRSATARGEGGPKAQSRTTTNSQHSTNKAQAAAPITAKQADILRQFRALLDQADEKTRREMRRILREDETPTPPSPTPRRRQRKKTRPGIEAEWGRVRDCIAISGFSEQHLFWAAGCGCFLSVKTGDRHNSPRLVNLASFREWIRSGARVPPRPRK